MRNTLLVLGAVVLLMPTTQACSLLYQEFNDADLDGDRVLANRGQSVVLIHLGTGTETRLSDDFFPRFQFAGTNPLVLVDGQEGLGADCSGDEYFRVLTTGGSEVKELAGVDAFHAGGNTLAWITADGLYITTLGDWDMTRIGSGIDRDGYPAVAVTADGKTVAVSRADGSVTLHDLQGKQKAKYTGFGDATWARALAWDGDVLIVARTDGTHAKFWIIDTDTGDRRAFQFASEHWNIPTIATGPQLLLHHGHTVLKVTDSGSQKLSVPGSRTVGAVAGDDKGAVILFSSEADGWSTADGILRIKSDGSFGTWHTEKDGKWSTSSRPAFAWQTGPTPSVTQGAPVDPTLEEAPAVHVAGVFLAMVAAALVRRRTA